MVRYDQDCSYCGRSPVIALGLCNTHYLRVKRYGDVEFTKHTKSVSKSGTPEYFIENSREVPGPLNTPCRVWKKAVDAAGYGRFGQSSLYAHREIYKLLVGPIPEGLFVCHRCDNRRCINIEHLFVGTANDNNQDMISKGRAWFSAKKENENV